VLGLSAAGRSVVIDSIDTRNSRKRLMVVAGHRSNTIRPRGFLSRMLASVAAEAGVGIAECTAQSKVAVAGIKDINPDAAWNTGQRTLLGVDIVGDHADRLSVETRILHDALEAWHADLVLDVAQTANRLTTGADIEITLHFVPEPDGSVPHDIATLGIDIGRRLKESPATSHIALMPCLPTSLTAATGLPLIELTASHAGNDATSEHGLDALLEAAGAVYQSIAVAPQRVPAPV
jgi:hypothetical protein